MNFWVQTAPNLIWLFGKHGKDSLFLSPFILKYAFDVVCTLTVIFFVSTSRKNLLESGDKLHQDTSMSQLDSLSDGTSSDRPQSVRWPSDWYILLKKLESTFSIWQAPIRLADFTQVVGVQAYRDFYLPGKSCLQVNRLIKLLLTIKWSLNLTKFVRLVASN